MKVLEVDPWIRNKISASKTYRVNGTLYTVPFTTSNDLTFKKSKEKYIEECRRLPNKYSGIFDEKFATSLSLEPPIELHRKLRVYLQESSSQHMSTIMEAVEEAAINFEKVDFLVASETLNKISGSVFNQERSWRLRAYVTILQGTKTIVLCDDDVEENVSGSPPAVYFSKERSEAMSFAQQLCERHHQSNTNFHLHGCLAVLSSFFCDSSAVNAIVFGEVDMVSGQQPLNTFVLSGIGRRQRMTFGTDAENINKCFEYLWSRSFWLGLEHSLFGLRPSDDESVRIVQKFFLPDFYRQHRHRNDRLADVATSCVARVLHELREAVLTDESVNWMVEYKGCETEPDNIKIYKAPESYSFNLIRQKYHMKRLDFMDLAAKIKEESTPKQMKRKMEDPSMSKKIRVYHMKRHDFLDLSGKTSKDKKEKRSIAEKIQNYIRLNHLIRQ